MQIQCNLKQNANSIPHRTRKISPKIDTEPEEIRIVKEKQVQYRKNHNSRIQTVLQLYH